MSHLRNSEGLRHILHQVSEIVLHELHDHENVVQPSSHCHLADIHNVFVVEAEQDVDLSDGSQGEAVPLLVHLDLLQGADRVGLLVPSPAQGLQGVRFLGSHSLHVLLMSPPARGGGRGGGGGGGFWCQSA